MPTKPTGGLEQVRWANAATNMTAPSSGQRSSGWTPGQDGVSDYMNVLLYGAYLWTQYFESATDDLLARRYLAQETHVMGPSRWLPTVAANASWSGGDWGGTSGLGFGLQAAIEFVPVGGTIQSARWAYNRAGAGVVTRSLFRVPTTAPGSAETIYSSTDTTTTGYQDITINGLDHVVADGYAYSLVVSFDAASDTAGARLFAGGVTWI